MGDRAVTMRIAHVVRDYGGVTEPFIDQRLRASQGLGTAELWTERSRGGAPLPERRIHTMGLRPASIVDRVFHRWPAIGPPLGRGYTQAERAFEPSLIHAHYTTTAYLVGSITRAPLVAGAYGFDVTVMSRRGAWRRAYAHLAERAAVTLVEGPFMAATLAGLGFPPERIAVVPIAAGLEAIQPAPRVDAGAVRVLACGRFVEKKGLDHAIEAFARALPALGEDAELRIVGDGPLGPTLRRLAATGSAASHVTFLGRLARPAFIEEMHRADLFLAPSRTAANGDGEGGAPTTILDAQASGAIVVGSTHADIPFIVEDGVTGFLAREGDVDSLVETIRRAMDARPDWRSIATVARRRMLERHADDAVAAELGRVYARVVR